MRKDARPCWARVNVPAPERRSDDRSRWVVRRVFAEAVDQQIVGQSECAKREGAIDISAATILGWRHGDGQHAQRDEWTGSAVLGFLVLVGDNMACRPPSPASRRRQPPFATRPSPAPTSGADEEPRRHGESDQPVEDLPRIHGPFSHAVRASANRRSITISPDPPPDLRQSFDPSTHWQPYQVSSSNVRFARERDNSGCRFVAYLSRAEAALLHVGCLGIWVCGLALI